MIDERISAYTAEDAVNAVLFLLDELAAMAIADKTYDEVAAAEQGLVTIMGRAELVQRLIWQRQKSRIRELQ